MALFDILAQMMGRPDPVAQLAAGLGQGPNQAGSPSGPQPLAAGGGASAPPPPTAGAPPDATGGAPPAAPPQPQAYQSSPDMMQMYAQLMQHQAGQEQFNRGLGMLLSSAARPWNRQAIQQQWSGMTPDAGEVMGNIMKLQQWNQQQQQYQTWLKAAPDAAGQLGITTNEALAAGPDIIKSAIQYGAKPEALRSYLGFRDYFVQQHANDPGPDGQPIGPAGAGKLFEQQNPIPVAMAGLTGAYADPIDQQRLLERSRWASDPNNKGKPVPAYYGDRASFVAHGQQVEQQTKDRGEAVQHFGDLNATLEPLANTLGDVAADPALPSLVGKNIATGFVPPLPGTAAGALDAKLGTLQRQAAAAAAKGGPGTAGTLTGMAVNAGDLTKYTTPEGDYRSTVLTPMIKQTLTAMANNYGASGQADNMPAYLRPYLSKVYQPGGELYVGSGSFKQAPQPAPGKKAITPEMLPAIQKSIETQGPARVFKGLQANKYDTSSLE